MTVCGRIVIRTPKLWRRLVVLRAYEDAEEPWEATEEPCLNCGAPVYRRLNIGLHQDGLATFPTAYKCFACETPHPSRIPLEEFEKMRREYMERRGD